MARKEIDLSKWRNYVSKESGILFFAETSNQATLPVRNQIDDEGNALDWEPDYETGTYGLRTCQSPKTINSIVKARHRYILFATRYNGLDLEYKDKYLVYGYMRIDKTIDTRDRHMAAYLRNPDLPPPACLPLKESIALWAGEQKFCSLADSFQLTDEVIARWGYSKKLTRQMKLVVEGEGLQEILAHFASKPDSTDEYIGTVQEFISALQPEEDEEE